MKISLSWPAKELNPNSRAHWAKRAKAAKAYRSEAWATAWQAYKPFSFDSGRVTVSLLFEPPDKRRRDLDNMLASLKPAIDGIADAIGIDDENFSLLIRRGEPTKGGRVAVEISSNDEPKSP